MSDDLRRFEEQLDQARRDLADLAEQVAAGELDEATAARLRAVYESEEAEARTRLAALGAKPGPSPAAASPEPGAPHGSSAVDRSGLEAERDRALRDLAAVERRFAAGDLDEDSAAGMRADLARTAARAAAALADLDETGAAPAPVGATVERPGSLWGRSRNRVLAGGAVIIVGLGIAIWAVTRSAEPRAATTTTVPTTVDSDVTNEELEAVVAANPEIAGMRAALAMRYFEERNLEKALEHQTIVVELEPTVDNYTILGLFAFEAGRNTDAAGYLEFALGMDPQYAPAQWYLANVYLYGTAQPDRAIPILDQLLTAGDVPDDIRHAVEEMIAIAHEGTEGP